METINHDGYEIVARPNLLAEGTWRLAITINDHRGDQTVSKSFTSSTAFQDREEAIRHCFEFGKRVIDGEIANYSVR